MPRHVTRTIAVGSVPIGGDAPISVQSMTKTDTRDAVATIDQIRSLEEAGCEIVRVAVPDEKAARQLEKIKAGISIPLIADIHFRYRLALMALESGVDGLRINPGNIGSAEKVAQVVREARAAAIPIRIGVNAGSLEKDLLEKYGHPGPPALVESALRHVRILEGLDFDLIKISIKASDVLTTVAAYRLLAAQTTYPLHLGITEAGTPFMGTIKSAVGIGMLLAEGIGDTIRVSLTGPPVEEVKVGFAILKALRLREMGLNIISCPTCGRCEVDVGAMVRDLETRLAGWTKPLTVAVMGCVVNGPGEAREADLGIAAGKTTGMLFRKGQPLGRVTTDRLVDRLVEEIERW